MAINTIWQNDKGYIKKFDGKLEANFFNPVVDRLYNSGVLAVCSLKEGCPNCEKLMLLIQNMEQTTIKRPLNMIIAWGVTTGGDDPRSHSINLKSDEIQVVSSEFRWERIKSHGFALSRSTSEYMIFEDDHSSQIFGRYIKKLYRRMSSDIITTRIFDPQVEFSSKSKTGVVIEYPEKLPEAEELKLERFFGYFKKRFLTLPYFLERSSGGGSIKYFKEGENIFTQNDLNTEKFLVGFNKARKR